MKASTAKGYREKIRKACRSVGTYKPEFEPAVTRLAEFYLRQKQLAALYQDSGGDPMVKAPGTPLAIKNPILDEMDRLSRLILELERELGLTPASLRRVNESAMAQKEAADPLSAAILSFRLGA